MYTAPIRTSSKEAAARASHPLGVAHTKTLYNARGNILVKIKVWRQDKCASKRNNMLTFKSTMTTTVFPFSPVKKLNNSLHVGFFGQHIKILHWEMIKNTSFVFCVKCKIKYE